MNYELFEGVPVGGRAGGPHAICDFSNKPLSNGDTVHALAEDRNGQPLVSWVIANDQREYVEDDDEDAAGEWITAQLTTAVFDPNRLVLCRIRKLGEAAPRL